MPCSKKEFNKAIRMEPHKSLDGFREFDVPPGKEIPSEKTKPKTTVAGVEKKE
ncbi:hypothetical protein KKC45_02655 [Patescibacteria group bacterium]|nr:hypothetical protein [Patescibacteria group bacterium]